MEYLNIHIYEPFFYHMFHRMRCIRIHISLCLLQFDLFGSFVNIYTSRQIVFCTKKLPVFLHTCAKCSVQPANGRTMIWTMNGLQYNTHDQCSFESDKKNIWHEYQTIYMFNKWMNNLTRHMYNTLFMQLLYRTLCPSWCLSILSQIALLFSPFVPFSILILVFLLVLIPWYLY